MDAMLMEWLKKKGHQFNPSVETDPLAVVSTPGDGGAVEETARKPLAIPVETQAIQSEPTPEDVAEASDPRASPETTDMRGSFDRMSNIFMAAGGLPQQPLRGNPYVTERDAMRDWVMKKDAAKRADANAQNQESRTAAYLAATQSQREQALAAQALRAEQEGRRAEAEKFRQELEAEKQRVAKDKEAFDQKLDTRKMDLEEKKFAKKSARGGAPKGFPAGWELEGKTQPTPKQGEQFEGLVYSSEKMRGLTAEMKKELDAVGARRVLPGNSRLKQLATEIQIEGKNVAELGALSGPDMGLMNSIAADPTKVDSFAKDLPRLLDGLNSWADNSVNAKAKSLGARRSGQKPVAAPNGPKTPSGKPYTKKQYSASKNQTRFVDEAGGVVEVADGRL